jgi:hypothetical protein
MNGINVRDQMRFRHCTALAAVLLACLAGVALAQPQASERAGDLEREYLVPLRAKSCPKGVTGMEGEPIALRATPVPLQGMNPLRKAIGDLTFVAGFHLVSPDTRFGGLSDVDLLDDGSLLTITDQGDLVWLDLADDGVTPTRARIASLQDVAGAPLRGKQEGDAEDIAYRDGLVLVSFERDHRVLAFDIAGCGAAARGAPLMFGGYGGDFAAAFDRQNLKVDGNSGTEGLAITPDWFLFAGLETPSKGASPLSVHTIEAAPEFDQAIGKGAPPVVGLDIIPDGDDLRVFSLHRSTNPLATNMITLLETRFTRELDQSGLPARRMSEIESRKHVRFLPTTSVVLAQMNVLVTVDNFEGVAARQMPDGRVRLYVVSDDNFSGKQRTLLMIYDVPSPA